MKPFTVAAALDAGIVTPDTQIQTAPGSMTIGGWTISDTHPNGLLTVTQVIQKSSNVGSAKIMLNIPRNAWARCTAISASGPCRRPGSRARPRGS
jgi:cell division protein FtsI (penicillin-binding protein 3)